MNGTLLALTGVVLGAVLLNGHAADPAVPYQTKLGQELHAAITDTPGSIDLSHADPKTWHGLPRAGQVHLAQDVEFPRPFSSRTRPF